MVNPQNCLGRDTCGEWSDGFNVGSGVVSVVSSAEMSAGLEMLTGREDRRVAEVILFSISLESGVPRVKRIW